MRVALAQLRATTDPAANLRAVADWAGRAATEGADLVVFPEATMCSFERASAQVAEPADGPWAGAVRDLARELGVTIAVGMFTTAPDGRVHNTLFVTGAAEARYDKVHLFDALGHRESDHIAPGAELVSVDLAGTRVGLTVCYDVRFPEQFRALAADGAQVILVAASWAPGPDKIRQWTTLTTARAMDSTAFLVAVDQAAAGGTERPGRPTGVGHSMVVDPLGRVLAELGTSEELTFVDIDPAVVGPVRAALPVLRG